MTTYVGFNWFCTVATAAILVWALLRHRFLIVKPSIVVLLFFHVRMQWAATLAAGEIEQYLPKPFEFAALAQLFPLIGSLGAIAFFNRRARLVWRRLDDRPPGAVRARRRATFMAAVCTALGVLVLLGSMGLTETGLYAIFFNPAASGVARSRFATEAFGGSIWRYSFHFTINVFAPMLAALVVLRVEDHFRARKWLWVLIGAAVIPVLLGVVSLSGARAYAANLILVIIWVLLLRHRFPLNPAVMTIAVVAVLALPAALSIMREGRVVGLPLLWQYLTENIARRVTFDTMYPGLWHVHYAQVRHGLVGVAGIPKLADLVGTPAINMPNIIGNLYGPGPHFGDVGGANACYVFSYYSYFGLWTLLPSLAGLWALDLALLVFSRLRDHLLLAVLAVASVAADNFVCADYTSVFLTNGFGVTLVVAWLLSHPAWRKPFVYRPVRVAATGPSA